MRIIREIGKRLAFAAQDSESFKENTNRRLAVIESKFWRGYQPEDEEQRKTLAIKPFRSTRVRGMPESNNLYVVKSAA